MEKSADLETKYQKLAAEYSKVRSQAIVLKKAVLEEQTKNVEMRDTIKEQEQKIRKHTHEMESLTFRNEQLAKRISVLQQELQSSINNKKGKTKNPENNVQTNLTLLDEELHKKILENAELVSTMADRELEINNYKDKIQWLEEKIIQLDKERETDKIRYKTELDKLALKNKEEDVKEEKQLTKESDKCESCKFWQREAERLKTLHELSESKPDSHRELCEYYETQIGKILEEKQQSQSECSSLWAETKAITTRLEQLTIDKNRLESSLEKCNEELHLTNQNYKAQLDAMTEHFAAQNEKITRQCDEIEVLRHKLSQKK